MKSVLIASTLLVSGLGGTAHANVGVFTGYGHSIELSSTEEIQMVSEKVVIVPGRGRFLFDGSVPGMDQVEYRCTFVLKNLKDKKVTVQVGFPLNTQFLRPPYDNKKKKTADLVTQYSFLAQEEEFQYSVRYVAGDRKKKLKNVFLWKMTFAPEETRTLRVSYRMPISMTLASTAIKRGVRDYGKRWYRNLETCMIETFGYVTKTGKSWSGKIEDAGFRVYVRGFEDYLERRPFGDETGPGTRAKSRGRFPVRVPMVVRTLSPAGWTSKDDGFLERSHRNYEPTENFLFRYYIIPFPRTPGEVKRMIPILSPKGMTAEDRQDLADIFREFNGKKTGNPRIAKFVRNQVWFGKARRHKIPESVLKAIETG